MVWYTVRAWVESVGVWNCLLCNLSFFLIACSVFLQTGQGGGFKESHQSKTKSNINQIHLAVEAFHREFGRYPEKLDELSGKNEREKLFHTSPQEVVDDYEMKYVFDTDHDGFVEVEGKKLEQKVAVWTYYKDKMITSWEH